MGAAQASLRRPKGIDDTRQAPRCRVRAGSFPRCPFGGRFRWPLRQDQSCYACFQGTASRETRVRNLGPRLGGGVVTSDSVPNFSELHCPLCRLELTLSLQGGGEKHASFKGQAAAAASSRAVAAPRSRRASGPWGLQVAPGREGVPPPPPPPRPLIAQSWRPGHPAPLPRTRTDGDGPGRRQDCAPPPAQRAAARNSSINRSKLPGKIFSSQTEAPPPSTSANKYRPRGGGGGSAAASREAPRGSQVPGKGRLFVRPAGARPPSAHGPAPCASPRPPPRSPPPASEASPRRRPSRPSARLLRAALRAPARAPAASTRLFCGPAGGTEDGAGGGPPGPWAHRGPGSAAPPPGTKPGPPAGPCVVQGPRYHPPTWR